MKYRAVSGETEWPYRDILSGPEILSMRERGSYVRYRRKCRAHSTHVAVFGGFILRGDRYGRVDDKYPSDIMDGTCIRPQSNGGTNPIRFTRSSAGAYT